MFVFRAAAVVALMQASESDAGLFQRLDPWQRFELGKVPGAQFQKVVKRALGDDQTTVHVELAERERRIHQQFALSRAVGEASRLARGPEPSPNAMLRAVGRFNFEIARAHQLPEPRRERYRHAATPPSFDWILSAA